MHAGAREAILPANPAFPRLSGFRRGWDADHLGAAASVLCAIHCAVTPFLLLLLPAFGKIWSHPSTHWGMALIVIPIAAAMMSQGYRQHRRKWILAAGVAGIVLVILGAVSPCLGATAKAGLNIARGGSSPAAEMPSQSPPADEDGCQDSCCPAVAPAAGGSARLHIPLASILTTFGGIFLVTTHLGNLCCCAACRKS